MDLDTHERRIFGLCDRLKDREHTRASEAGEDRQEIGQLLELTGLNKKALSFVRSLDKMEDNKREDVLRSLRPLLKLFQPRWDTGTPDMLPQDEESNVAPFVPRDFDPRDDDLGRAAAH